MIYSKKWKSWHTNIDFKTCLICKKKNGKIYAIGTDVSSELPAHLNCRCFIEKLKAMYAGTATEKGIKGADWYIKYYNKLPEYYITRKEAEFLGWKKKKGNLAKIAPDQMITGGVYRNDDGKLPDLPDRVWNEADLDYNGGFRNSKRIIFSNDGLIFVTYDHYNTFIEII